MPSSGPTAIHGLRALRHPEGVSDELEQAVRRRILAAAKHKFARFGYEGTTLENIARSADVSPAELAEQFSTKLEILIEVFDEGWASINRRLEDIVLTSVTSHDAALSMLGLMLRILEKDEDLARLLLFEGRRPDPETGEIVLSGGYRQFERLCVELAYRGQKDGSFSGSYNPRLIACMLTGAVENIMRSQVIGEQNFGTPPFSPREVLSAFEAMVSTFKSREY